MKYSSLIAIFLLSYYGILQGDLIKDSTKKDRTLSSIEFLEDLYHQWEKKNIYRIEEYSLDKWMETLSQLTNRLSIISKMNSILEDAGIEGEKRKKYLREINFELSQAAYHLRKQRRLEKKDTGGRIPKPKKSKRYKQDEDDMLEYQQELLSEKNRYKEECKQKWKDYGKDIRNVGLDLVSGRAKDLYEDTCNCASDMIDACRNYNISKEYEEMIEEEKENWERHKNNIEFDPDYEG
jgi:hypothetical protein